MLDDIVDLQEKEVVQSTRGIYVKDFKSDKVGIENIKNNLIRLFDNTSDLDNEIEEEKNDADMLPFEKETGFFKYK